MIYAFVGAKGGVGNTVNAFITARIAARAQGKDVVLVDITGDLGVVLGTAPNLSGIANLLAGDDLSAESVQGLLLDVSPGVQMLPRGDGDIAADDIAPLWTVLSQEPSCVIVDAGRGAEALALVAGTSVRRILTMTCCYQAIHWANKLLEIPDSVDDLVIVTDAQRALGLADAEHSIGRHASAVVSACSEVARWADAGLLLDKEAKGSAALATLL